MEALLSKLNIKENERQRVLLLLLQSIFIGIFIAYYYSFANGYFLSHFEIKVLPVAYIASGLFGFASSSLFAKLQNKMPYDKLVNYTLLAIIGVVAAFKLSIAAFGDKDWLVFVIFMCFMPVSILSALSFWGMAMKLFNLREGKRVFPVLTSGEVISGLIGFISVPLVLKILPDTSELLYFALAGLVIAVVLQKIISNRFFTEKGMPAKQQNPVKDKLGVREILQSKYYSAVVVLSILSMMGVVLVDFSFLGISREQFPDKVLLTGFIGYFFSLIKIVEFVFKTFLTGKILEKYGLKLGLILLPIVLLIFTGFSIISLGLNLSKNLVFLPLAMNMFFLIVLKKSVEDPAFKMLFQPLEPTTKLSVQTLAEGKARQLGTIVAGGALIIFNWSEANHFLYSSLFLLVCLLGWLFAVNKVHYRFKELIKDMLARNKPSVSNVGSKSYVTSLERLQFSDGKVEKSVLNRLFPGLIYYTPTQVKKAVNENPVQLVNQANLESKIQGLLAMEEQWKPEFSNVVISNAMDANPEVRKLCMHLIGSNNISAETYTNALLTLGEVSLTCNLYYLISQSSDVAELIVHLDQNINRSRGDFISDKIQQLLLIQLMGGQNGNAAKDFLFEKLISGDVEIQTAVINMLTKREVNFTPVERTMLKDKVRAEAEYFTWLTTSVVDLEEDEVLATLVTIMKSDLERVKNRLYGLLSFLYGKANIEQIKSAIEGNLPHEHMLAIEMLESILDEDLKPIIIPIFDFTSHEEKLDKLFEHYPFPHKKKTPRLREVIHYEANRLNDWIRLNAIQIFGQISRKPREEILANLFNRNELLKQEAYYTLYKMDYDVYHKYFQLEEDIAFRHMLAELTNEYKHDVISAFEKVALLLGGNFLPGVDPLYLMKFAAFMSVNKDIPSEINLLKKRDEVVFLVEGEMSIETEGTSKVYAKGDMVGAIQPFNSSQAEIKLSQDIRYLRIPAENFKLLCLVYPEVTNALLEKLANVDRLK